MVGAKSLGCVECKRRKVKCDQRFPTCVRCERLGFSCSGPKSRFIRFVRPGSEEHIDATNRGPTKDLSSPSATASERLAAKFVRHLISVEDVGFQCKYIGLFMAFIPSRIGHNGALDASVRCLLQAHKLLMCGSGTPEMECMDDYNEAVALIRRDLNNGQAQTPTETVCAALILSSYEIYRKDNCCAWITHAGGVSAILECWGPDRITSDFEMAIFTSHYGSIISSAILAGKKCFLDSSSWLSLRKRSLKTFPQLDKYSMDCLTGLATLPNLLYDIKRVEAGTEHPKSLRSLLCRAQDFKAKIAQHSTKLHLDFIDPAVVREQRSPSNLTVLEFCKPEVAFRFNFYWSITIVANKLLLELDEKDNSLVQEYEDAAEDICRSLRYLNSLKPLGSLWLTFAASMAFGVSGDENKHRIVDAMNGAYDPVQIRVDPVVLENTFDILTGGICQIGKDGLAKAGAD